MSPIIAGRTVLVRIHAVNRLVDGYQGSDDSSSQEATKRPDTAGNVS